ncbi:hypothetical protein SLEP1_g14025 [Rubroshorea leprosula]|uniref:Ribosomal protein S8 n=2 Tax=Rubroshorea leprosula TaxID=152421 RepID=A0AAV5IHN9_9ROSI|nr:hypothetical protein SLEP1_g14025 [Rubroshorea leprosula]
MKQFLKSFGLGYEKIAACPNDCMLYWEIGRIKKSVMLVGYQDGILFLMIQLAFEAMVMVSVLNDALKSMYNAEKRGKRQVTIRPSSKVIIKFLLVMQKHGYIGEFKYVDDHKVGKIVVEWR